MDTHSRRLPLRNALRAAGKTIDGFIKIIVKPQSKVRKRLFADMINGILCSGSTKISEIVHSIHDRCHLPHSREKRVSYELQQGRWDTVNSQAAVHQAIRTPLGVDDETIFAVDFTDIEKEHAHIFEHLDRVHDGSTGKVVNGFLMVIIEAIRKHGNHVPLYLQMFSTAAKGFRSMNNEVQKGVQEVIKTFGRCGWWVMDRGFDGSTLFALFHKEGLRFIIRGCKRRYVWTAEQERKLIEEIVQKLPLPGNHPFYHYFVKSKKGNRNKWEKRQCRVHYGYTSVFLPYGFGKMELRVVVFDDIGKAGQRSYFYTNAPVSSLADALRIGKRYGLRWGCEEEIRFMKQTLSLEDIRVQNYRAIQRMVFFVYVVAVLIWLIEQKMRQTARKVYKEMIDFVCLRKEKPKWIMYKFFEAVRKIFDIKDILDYSGVFVLGKL